MGIPWSLLLARIGFINELVVVTGYAWYSIVALFVLTAGFVGFILAPRLTDVTLKVIDFLEGALQRMPLQDLIGVLLDLSSVLLLPTFLVLL